MHNGSASAWVGVAAHLLVLALALVLGQALALAPGPELALALAPPSLLLLLRDAPPAVPQDQAFCLLCSSRGP
mgnify:CR=1 FL=1